MNLSPVKVLLLQTRPLRNVALRFIQTTPNDGLILSEEGTAFQVYKSGNGISLHSKGWLRFTGDVEQDIILTESPHDASVINVSTAQLINDSTLQLDLRKLNPEIQKSLSHLGSFGILLMFERKIFGKSPLEKGGGTENLLLPTKELCEATNAYWNPIQELCFSCKSQIQYPDRLNMTCRDCPRNSLCGEGGGYCFGQTTNGVPCFENPETGKYGANCSENICGGSCGGRCSGKVFGRTCQVDSVTGLYYCAFDPSKWWMLFLWILFFLLLITIVIASIIIGVRLKRGQPIFIKRNQSSISSEV